MGVPVMALFRENKIRESQYYCHSRNLNPSKFMPYTVYARKWYKKCTNWKLLCTENAAKCTDACAVHAHRVMICYCMSGTIVFIQTSPA